jgi:hypothetical protein
MTSAIKAIAATVVLAAATWALASRGGVAGMTEDEWVHTAHSVQLRPPMRGSSCPTIQFPRAVAQAAAAAKPEES